MVSGLVSNKVLGQYRAVDPRFQFRIIDWVLLVSILGLELAGMRNAALFSLFISATIATLALSWKRAIFRNVLLLAIVTVYIAMLVAVVFERRL